MSTTTIPANLESINFPYDYREMFDLHYMDDESQAIESIECNIREYMTSLFPTTSEEQAIIAKTGTEFNTKLETKITLVATKIYNDASWDIYKEDSNLTLEDLKGTDDTLEFILEEPSKECLSFGSLSRMDFLFTAPIYTEEQVIFYNQIIKDNFENVLYSLHEWVSDKVYLDTDTSEANINKILSELDDNN